MNVATRLLLQQMERDIKELKQSVAALEQRVNELEAESRETVPARTTLTLPEKRTSNG